MTEETKKPAAPVPESVALTPNQMAKALATIVMKIAHATGGPVCITKTEVDAADFDIQVKQLGDTLIIIPVKTGSQPGIVAANERALHHLDRATQKGAKLFGLN